MYEVLGLFILFIVGIMLVTEGGHLAHLKIFGNEIVPMSKTTFYFVIAVLVVVDIVQGRYQKKINKKKRLQKMRKFKLKSFLTIFVALLVIQFLIVFADVMLTKSESSLVSATDQIIEFFSLPISLINKSLPFYVRESLPVKAIYWLINIFIQSSIIYLAWRVFRRVRKKMK